MIYSRIRHSEKSCKEDFGTRKLVPSHQCQRGLSPLYNYQLSGNCQNKIIPDSVIKVTHYTWFYWFNNNASTLWHFPHNKYFKVITSAGYIYIQSIYKKVCNWPEYVSRFLSFYFLSEIHVTFFFYFSMKLFHLLSFFYYLC